MKWILPTFIFCILFSTNVTACSWGGLTQDNIGEYYSNFNIIILGRVIETEEAEYPLSAKIQVIESFKGSNETYIYNLTSSGACAHYFWEGAELIYFVKGHSYVSASSVELKNAKVINALRKLKNENK